MTLQLKRTPRFPPRGPRNSVSLASVLLLPDDREIKVRIRNLAPRGVMIEIPILVPTDTALGIEIPGCGIIRGIVRWSRDGRAGVRFEKPINIDRMG